MATLLKNKLLSTIGPTPQLVIATAGNTRSTLIGLSLTNLTSGIVLATIKLDQCDTDGTTVLTSAHYIKEVIVPPNQSLRVINGGEKLVLSGYMKVYVSSTVVDSLDLVASYVDLV